MASSGECRLHGFNTIGCGSMRDSIRPAAPTWRCRWPAATTLRWFWGLVFLVALSAHAAAQQTTDQRASANNEADGTTLSQGELRRIVRRLEADTLAERDAAEKRLIELGPDVLPLLPTVSPTTSGELKVRLQRIRQALESEKIRQYAAASHVTLDGEWMVPDALDEIARQTGNPVRLQFPESVSNRMVALHADGVPFWHVLQTIMEQADLQLVAFGTTDNELVLGPRQGSSQPGPWFDGPVRVDPLFTQSTLNFRSALEGQLQVSALVSWEPRLQPVFLQIPMRELRAEADGEVYASVTPEASPEIPLNVGGSSTQIDLLLDRPPRSVARLDSLRGRLVIAIPSEKHRFEFERFSSGARQSQRYGDVTVILEGARRNGPVWEFRILVEFGSPEGALESFRGWILSNEAFLLGPGERRLENVGFQTYAVTPTAVGIAYLFQINGDPDQYRLVYESPAGILRHAVDFELKDIPLP